MHDCTCLPGAAIPYTAISPESILTRVTTTTTPEADLQNKGSRGRAETARLAIGKRNEQKEWLKWPIVAYNFTLWKQLCWGWSRSTARVGNKLARG